MADAGTGLGPEAAGLVAEDPHAAVDENQKVQEMREVPPDAPPPKSNEEENAAATSGGHYQPAGEKPKADQHVKPSFFAALKRASGFDIFLLCCGTLASAGVGALLPSFFVIFGDLLEQLNTTLDTDYYVHLMAWLGLGAFVAALVSTSCFEIVADKQTRRFKERYFGSIIRQEMAWYDEVDVGGLSSRLDSNIAAIRSGIGLKLSMLIQLTTVIIGALVIAFIKSWKLTLVCSACVPVLACFGGVVGWAVHKQEAETIGSYATAGSISEETFMSVRTVVSLGLEGHMAEKYRRHVKDAERAALRAAVWVAVGLAGIMMSVFFMSALSLWYGAELLADSTEEALDDMPDDAVVDPYNPATWPKPKFSGSSAITVFLVILIGAFSLGQVIPSFTALVKANSAAADLEELIERPSAIDPLAAGGRTDVQLNGDIEFKNVAFSYPSRRNRPIFSDLNLRIPGGKSVALVGGSGCGKSTILQLLQRLYDCDKGEITIGGVPIKDINVATLRANMGVVSQEPRLFSTTVRKNIELGSSTPVTLEEVVQAAQQANADSFVSRFPDKYDTDCGAYGGQLSGGQKQRIAIARALIRRPNILIFDEATSALDNQSERVVQDALDALVETSKSTRLIVAHRLSTIQNADLIIVLEPSPQGATVVQQGTHHELMKDTEGLYYHLVSSQIVPEPEGPEDTTEEEPAGEQFVLVAKESIPVSGELRRSTIRYASAIVTGATRAVAQNISFRTYKLIWENWLMVIVSLIAAAGAGIIFPVFGYAFSNFISTYFSPDPDSIRDGASKWALVLVGLGVAQGITNGVKIYGIDYCGYKVATLLRDRAFTQTAHQDVAFFDLPENNAGKLCSILSADVLDVKIGSTGNVVSVVQVVASFTTGLVIAFCSEWRLALVILAFCFILIPSNILGARIRSPGPSEKSRGTGLEDQWSSVLMNQATSGIRVVSAFGLEGKFIVKYSESIAQEHATKTRDAVVLGLTYGFSQATQFFVNCLALWYGGKLVADRGIDPTVISQTIFALTFAVSAFGETVLFTTDAAKAAEAGRRVYGLIDRVSQIDVREAGGKRLDHDNFAGTVEFDRVNFTYPTRPDNRVYRNLSFNLDKGETIALVGASGCGKSTVVQLVERFYDLKNQYSVKVALSTKNSAVVPRIEPKVSGRGDEGRILLDSDDIRELNVVSVRRQEGLVSQEPVLFDMTIEENIALSKPDATRAEIEEAAALANAAGFITAFPNGYQTHVGRGGAQLSGGQKQRIAIARALIRKPRLLILDEATSALDAESERIVQQTIDELLAAEKRSTIIIAHRLSTVRHADKIIVLTNEDRRGSRVAEVGTHDELMQKKGGLYRTLVGLAKIQSA